MPIDNEVPVPDESCHEEVNPETATRAEEYKQLLPQGPDIYYLQKK